MATHEERDVAAVDIVGRINHTKRHRITWDNVHDACLVNEDTVNILLYTFRDVYVHDETQGESTPSIVAIMSQVRHKTNLKIINIELYRRACTEEYNFLFGVQHAQCGEIPYRTRSEETGDCEIKRTSCGTRVLTLYTDMYSMQRAKASMANNTCAKSRSQGLKAFAHVIDAMAAAPKQGLCNTFSVLAFEISTRDVCLCASVQSAQYARNSQEFCIFRLSSLIPVLFLEIQIRGRVNTVAQYMYGPFPIPCARR